MFTGISWDELSRNHNGVSMNRKPGGIRNAEDLMRKLVKVDPNELKQPKKKPLKRKPKK